LVNSALLYFIICVRRARISGTRGTLVLTFAYMFDALLLYLRHIVLPQLTLRSIAFASPQKKNTPGTVNRGHTA
jgi:hypothetical protein